MTAHDRLDDLTALTADERETLIEAIDGPDLYSTVEQILTARVDAARREVLDGVEALADELDRTGQIAGRPVDIAANRLGLQYASKRLRAFRAGDA